MLSQVKYERKNMKNLNENITVLSLFEEVKQDLQSVHDSYLPETYQTEYDILTGKSFGNISVDYNPNVLFDMKTYANSHDIMDYILFMHAGMDENTTMVKHRSDNIRTIIDFLRDESSLDITSALWGFNSIDLSSAKELAVSNSESLAVILEEEINDRIIRKIS